MICIVKLFKILFKGLDVFMFVMHLKGSKDLSLEITLNPLSFTSDAVIHLSHQSFVIFHFFS